jgi:ABC-type branched-subunit amino acid transport system substrate-binding protein
MHRRRNLTAIAVLGLVAVLAVVGGASAGAKQKTAAIKIFVIAPVATPIENYPDALAGVEGAATAINKAGGMKGQKIEVGFCNTQSNPNGAAACARQAVSEGATFVTGYLGVHSPVIFPILLQARIPVIGARSAGNPIDWTTPITFPIAGGAASNYQAIPFAMKKLGKKRFFISYQDVPSAATNAKNTLRAARIAGLPVAGTMVLPGATTDFAPYVQKLRDANPDSVTFINSPGVSGGLMRAATALGVKVTWSHNSGSIGEPEAAQIGPPSEGMLIASDLPSFRDTQYAGVRHFRADMKAAGKDGDPVNLKVTGLATWLATYAVKTLSPNIKGAVTNTSLLAALQAQKKPLNVEGLTMWAPGRKGPAAYPRWNIMMDYWMTFRNGQSVSWGKALPPIELMKALKFVR